MREQFLRNNPGVELPPGEQMRDSQIMTPFFGIFISVLSTLAGLHTFRSRFERAE